MGDQLSNDVARRAGPLKRRGLLAGVAALTAGLAAKLGTAERAEATHGGAFDVILGQYNDRGNSQATVIQNSDLDAPAISGANGFYPGQPSATYLSTADGTQGITNKDGGAGVRGMATWYGVVGQVVRGGAPPLNTAVGVLGQTAFGAGVRGEVFSPGSNTGSGVVGVAAGCEFGNASSVGIGGSGRGVGGSLTGKTGVLGIADNGAAVQGWARFGGTGVRGSSNSGGGPDFGGSGIGLEGRSGTGNGVLGSSSTNAGVFGSSTQNAGVFGASAIYGVWGRSVTGFGVNGEAVGAGIGVYGKAGAGGWAGYFDGNLYVSSTVTQGGGSGPEAASSRMSAAMAEDVGEAQLANGRALITLDPGFAEGAQDGGYLVFLTEEEDNNGLFVTKKGATSFEVRAKGSPNAGGRFSYRALAKRPRGAGPSADRGAAPSVVIPKDIPVPTLPETPATPDLDPNPQGNGTPPEPPQRRDPR